MKGWMFKLVTVVNSAVGAGRKQLATWHSAGVTPDKVELSNYLQMVLAEYQPEVKGVEILTPEDREHLTLALSGILINVMDAETSKETVV